MGAGLDTLGRCLDALAAGLDGFAGRLDGALRCFCCLCSLPSGPYPLRFPDGLGGAPGAGSLPTPDRLNPITLLCALRCRCGLLARGTISDLISCLIPDPPHRTMNKALALIAYFPDGIFRAPLNTVLGVLAAILMGRFFFFSGLPRLPARA